MGGYTTEHSDIVHVDRDCPKLHDSDGVEEVDGVGRTGRRCLCCGPNPQAMARRHSR